MKLMLFPVTFDETCDPFQVTFDETFDPFQVTFDDLMKHMIRFKR